MNNLPINDVLPDIKQALASHISAIVIAPPGAGKTTAIAPALLDEHWCQGKIYLLAPRRLAARAAAEHMASLRKEKAGETIGYMTRMDSNVSGKSRIIVMTYGIFLQHIQKDPELSGVSAVLFDEVHERALDCDFGLALALESQGALREDLRICAMSATLNGKPFAALLGRNAAHVPIIESKGKIFPLTLHHIGRNAAKPLESDIARAVGQALDAHMGDILVFLPGILEINRAARALSHLDDERHIVHRLYGAMSPRDQRAVLSPDPEQRRKIILATNIAESSLTIDGVRIVVDAGLTRRADYDIANDVSHLVTRQASQAAATQRAGRAARQGEGQAYRLWQEAATKAMPPFDPPEISHSELSNLVLNIAAWGESDPLALAWLDAPPAPALSAAQRKLHGLGAIDDAGHITGHGRILASLPMEPHIAHMLVFAAENGALQQGAALALLLQERGLGGQSDNLENRLERFLRGKDPASQKAKKIVQLWCDLVRNNLRELPRKSHDDRPPPAITLAAALPDNIAKKQAKDGSVWHLSGGQRCQCAPESPLAAADWLVVAQKGGKAGQQRIFSAIPLTEEQLHHWLGDKITKKSTMHWDKDKRKIQATLSRKLGAITLSSGHDPNPDKAAISAALLEQFHEDGLDLLPLSDNAKNLLKRAEYAGFDALTPSSLQESAELWLAPLLDGKNSFSAITSGDLTQSLLGLIGYQGQQDINAIAPENFTSPAGTSHVIDYGHEAGPMVKLRVQALFGLECHPVVGKNRVPLILSLTSPAGRPIQTTADLPGFWAGSWRDVAKDMRAQYPKHNWPDDPTQAIASLKTKNALKRYGK